MSRFDPVYTLLDSGAIGAPMPKSVTVPANKRLLLTGAVASFTTSAQVGNRQLVLEIRDDTAELFSRNPTGATIAKNLTRYARWGVVQHTAFVLDTIIAALPELVLEPGWTVRLVDDANIDSAADAARLLVSGFVQDIRTRFHSG